MAKKKKAAPKAPADIGEENWDQGEVVFVTTFGNGTQARGNQMCWNRQRFIARMEQNALDSKKDKDKDKHFSFTVIR